MRTFAYRLLFLSIVDEDKALDFQVFSCALSRWQIDTGDCGINAIPQPAKRVNARRVAIAAEETMH